MLRVSAIIPAYNEENTILGSIDIASKSELIDEIIVVSDGSTDKTVEISKNCGKCQVIDLKKNVGKAGAMSQAVKNTTGDVIMFIDADLHGLTIEHINNIIKPVKFGEVDMCIAVRDKSTPKNNYIVRRYLTHIAGERAIKKEIWQKLPSKYKSGYMIETALNGYCRLHNLPIGDVFCPGLGIVRKEDKWGQSAGFWSRRKLHWDLVKAHAFLYASPFRWYRAFTYNNIKRYKPWIDPTRGM